MNSKAYPTSFRADLGKISRSFRLWTVVAAIFLATTVASLVAAFAGDGFGTEAYAAENQTVVVSAADARIVEDAPGTNYGRATTVQVDGDDPDGSGKDKSGLIRWDLSGLPAGSKITSASVSVNVTDASVSTYQAYNLRRPWTEPAATWNLFATGSAWEVAGAKGPHDREAEVAGSIKPSTTGKQTFALSPEVVQGWVDDPSANRGIVIAHATNKDGFAFNSRDFSDAALRPQLAIVYGTVDNTPPETTIDSGPSHTANSASADFAFSSSEAGSSFECKLDDAPFSPCTSPEGYAGLTEGSSSFSVRAIDAAGNPDATPASRTWTVDTVAPGAPMISSPADGTITNDSTPAFGGTAEANSVVEVFDGGAPLGKVATDGSGDWSFVPSSALGDGNHPMTAKATDAAGNTSSASATVGVTIDTVGPETTIDGGPSGSTSDVTAEFSFSSEANATFECKLDDGDFRACISPKEYTGFADGPHAFRVRATDAAGNVDASPAERSWTVSTASPAVTRSFASAADARIFETAPTTKYGSTTVQVDGDNPDGSGKDESGLVRWDLSGIAPGTPIGTASVTVNVTDASVSTYQAHALKRPWAEPAVTWNLYNSGMPWETAGAKGSLDRGAGVVGSIWPSTTGKQTFALSPEVVQGWVSDPASNQGIVIAHETNTDGFKFSSRESADPALHPQLTITTQATPAKEGAVLAGVGDVHAACSRDTDKATADLLDGIAGTVFTLGDNTHNGTAAQYEDCYGRSWGRHKHRTQPVPGNHDYETAGASGYYGYFGAAAGDPTKGYYSYDRGEWHVVVLNSMCDKAGGCGSTSPMLTWLKKDLAVNPTKCTLVAWHHPLFSSGAVTGSMTKMKPAYRILYDNHADVVLSSHDHIYERFAPQDPEGVADPKRGIREFVVGTGGGGLHALGTAKPNSEVRNNDSYGVLKMTLKADGYDWEFVPVTGNTFTDSGSDSCH